MKYNKPEKFNPTPEELERVGQQIAKSLSSDKIVVAGDKKIRGCKNSMRVHLNSNYFGNHLYIFTKDEKHCVAIEYNPDHDFGKGSPSGARIESVEIHTNNGFFFKDTTKEINLSDVPECILELLTYLK